MKFFLSFLLLLNLQSSIAQNLTGLWSGNFNNSRSSNPYIFYPVSFDITYDPDNNVISGINRTISWDNIYSNFKIEGYFNKEKNYYYIEETQLIETNYSDKDYIIKNYFLLRFKGKNKLTGDCFCINFQTDFCKDKLIIYLKRNINSKKK